MVLGAGQGEPLDPTALRQRERRRPPARIPRIERLEPIRVEVVDHRPHPVLGRERHLRDRRHVHTLRRKQHHLRPAPRHHRPRRPPHNPQQPVPFLVRDLANSHSLSHLTSLRDQLNQVVDAPPERSRSGH